jgi:hypothetical protein
VRGAPRPACPGLPSLRTASTSNQGSHGSSRNDSCLPSPSRHRRSAGAFSVPRGRLALTGPGTLLLPREPAIDTLCALHGRRTPGARIAGPSSDLVNDGHTDGREGILVFHDLRRASGSFSRW